MRLRGRYKPNILMADSRSSGKSSEEINPESATFGFNYQLFFSSFEENNIIHSQYPRSGQKKKKLPNARNVTVVQSMVALASWPAQCSPTVSFGLVGHLPVLGIPGLWQAGKLKPISALCLLK